MLRMVWSAEVGGKEVVGLVAVVVESIVGEILIDARFIKDDSRFE